jgi:hypothetical protein
MIIRNADVVFLTQDILQPQAFHLHRFLLLDRDAKFGAEVLSAVRDKRPTRTAFRSPWQNGVAERLGGKLPTRLGGTT